MEVFAFQFRMRMFAPVQHIHSKGVGNTCHALTDASHADDAHGQAGQLKDRIFAVGKVCGPLPFSGFDRLSMFRNVVCDGKQHCKYMLCDRFGRIGWYIADSDAFFAGSLNINRIIAGSGDADQLQIRTGVHRFTGNRAFVDKNDLCITDTVDNPRLFGAVINNQCSKLFDSFPTQVAWVEGKSVQNQNLHSFSSS